MTPVPGVCWEHSMMLLEEDLVCCGVSFHPPVRPGSAKGFESVWRVGAVPGLPGLISSVVCGIEVRPPLGDLGHALFSQALLVLRGHPGVASWLSHTHGLPGLKGGSVTSSRHPAHSAPEVEVGQVALKRPAAGHFLAASDARLRDPREH